MEKNYQELAKLESLDEIDGYEDFVFINRFGHVQNQGTLNKAIRRVIRDFNVAAADKGITDPEEMLPHFSCHILRHTYATRLMECGSSLKFLQYQMGHADIQTTFDRYLTGTNDFKHKEIGAFEDYMKAVLNIMPTNIPVN